MTIPKLMPVDNDEELFDSIDMFSSENPYNPNYIERESMCRAVDEIRYDFDEIFAEVVLMPAKCDSCVRGNKCANCFKGNLNFIREEYDSLFLGLFFSNNNCS